MSFRWIHLSDFHFTQSDSYEHDSVLNPLLSEIERRRNNGFQADAVFVTGDIAYSGNVKEYQQATNFFDALLQSANLNKSRLFVVPGNHDLDKEAGSGLKRTLDDEQESVGYFADGKRKYHFEKFQAFRDWFNAYFSGLKTCPPDSTCHAPETLKTHSGLCVAVLPLNSALFSLPDRQDHNSLWIGRRNLDAALEKLKALNADFNIALLHHPLDWLHTAECSNIKAVLQEQVDIILRGHLHENEIASIASSHGDCLHLAAGACYQTRQYPNTALLCTVNFAAHELEVEPIRYTDSPKPVWTLDTSLFLPPKYPDYIRRFSLPKSTLTSTITRSDEQGGFSPSKPVFSVPFASKGEQMIGRQAALEQVHHQLHSGIRTAIGQTAAFQGLGGLGKTQLAVEYAYAYQKDYTNGVIWINADQDLNVQLIQLAEKSWVSPVADQAFKLTTAIKRLHEVPDCLIIFDNLENLETIKEILPAANVGSHILVTSRFEQTGFVAIPLDTLSPEQGLQLLLQEAERQPQNSDENQAAASIVQQLDGLPLALELAGAFLQRRTTVSWQQYSELLHKNLPAAFLSSHASWTKHEADIYSTLKIHESLFNEEPLLKPLLNALTWSGSTAMSESLLCALLAESEATNLIGALSLGCALRILQQSDDKNAYAVHRLVREVRRVELPLTGSPEWMSGCAECLGEWFEKHRRDFSDLALFEANFDHLPAWQKNAQTLGLPLLAARLLWLQAYPAWHWGRYREAQQLLEQAQDLSSQSPTVDIALKAHLLNDLGLMKHALGDSKAALALSEEALNLRLDLFGEEHQDTADSLNDVAVYYNALGQPAQALDLGEQALQIRRTLFGEQHPDTARSLSNIAGYYYVLDQPAQALDLGEQSLQIRRKLFGEEHPATATSLNNVALNYHALGKPAQALELSEQALRIQRTLFGEEHPDTASLLGNIALYYHALGQLAQALELSEQAWLIHQKLFGDVHPDTVLSNYNLIGYLMDNKQRPEALKRLDTQLSLLKKDHPHHEKLQRLRAQLLSKPIRPGFRQPAKNPGKNKPKKRR
ncbi:MAG: tetratricopeptide repeat protein [Methylobacter sp.]|nr:MAG: tetratricopeptide repeat protein [Methylobacter sp.]